MAKRPLARTYRPQRFADVLGQQAPVKALGAAAERRELAAAYIFSGTRGIGKTTIARIFAKALNCEQGPAADCCDACAPCREIAEGRSLDVLEMDAATHTGIDDVRELREAAQYPPSTAGRYRVFIVDEAHQLSTAAWNGLLKILEEPPDWCVFLFCTTEPHKIPATIESRSLHFAFKSPPEAEIRDYLGRIAEREGLEVTPEALALLAKAAAGSVRDGLSALDQARALAGTTIDAQAVREALGLVPEEAVRDYVRALGTGEAAAALAILDRIEGEGHDLRTFAAEALERVRRLALAKALGPQPPGAEEVDAEAIAPFRTEQLVWFGKVLDETETRLRQGGPQRTLLDLATVRMTKLADLTPLETLAAKLSGAGGPSGPAPGGRPGRPSGPAPPPPPARPNRASAPAPPSAPADGTAAPDAAPRASAGEPLGRLADAAARVSGRIGSYLRRASEMHVTEGGVLVITMPASCSFWKSRLEERSAQKVISQSAAEVLGSPPARIELRLAEADATPPAPRRARNGDALAEARRDPLVREIFERFDAVLIEGETLAGEPPPPAEPPSDGPRPGAPR